MKTAEIEIGGEYAIDEYGSAKKGVALEVGHFDREVYRSGSYRPNRTSAKGVLIHRHDYSGKPLFLIRDTEFTGRDLFETRETVKVTSDPTDEPATEWVLPAKVTSTWEAHVAGQRARATRTQSGQERAKELQEAFEAAGFKYVHCYFGRQGNDGGERLRISGLESNATKLLELLRSAAPDPEAEA